jgi:subtilisin family serine protease
MIFLSSERHRHVIVIFLVVVIGFASDDGFASSNKLAIAAVPAVPLNRIMVKPKSGGSLTNLHQSAGTKLLNKFPEIGGLEIVEVPAGTLIDSLVQQYQQSGLVEYAEPDHIVHGLVEPNDFNYQNQDCWHIKNVGQYGGTVGADIDALLAWDTRTSASNIIVAVLDSGVRYTHEDLAGNMWHNPNEIPGNEIDDDGNGYVDDIHGIDVIAPDGNPNDDNGHGTHVAGIIGAVGNNGVGVVGVCWQVRIMACKFLNSVADGSVSDAIICINYARVKGAKIINLSWGNVAYNSQALSDAIASARNEGIIVVCACGNSDHDNDINPLYPASFGLDNIVSVAATTRQDARAPFSSYGLTTVDLGAPGDPVFSCWFSANNAYQYYAGTSMAAPLVAGACALVWARYPTETYSQIIARVVNNTDPLPALADKCVSGGRLNLQKALTSSVPLPAPHIESVQFNPPASVVLRWTSVAGANYRVQSATNLSPANWQDLSPTITASGATTGWTNNVSGVTRRYYLLKMLN